MTLESRRAVAHVIITKLVFHTVGASGTSCQLDCDVLRKRDCDVGTYCGYVLRSVRFDICLVLAKQKNLWVSFHFWNTCTKSAFTNFSAHYRSRFTTLSIRTTAVKVHAIQLRNSVLWWCTTHLTASQNITEKCQCAKYELSVRLWYVLKIWKGTVKYVLRLF